ncbi:MAG: hypothetical protein ACRYFW_14395 [Janthinobacterium lividum]
MIRALFTPGRYLEARRCAAGASIEDVAATIFTDPATPERDRKLQLELIEADAQPMALETIAALRGAFPFDVDVLVRLAQIAQGQDVVEPMLCHICGWGTVYDQLFWPIQRLCRTCHDATLPEDRAAWVARYQAQYTAAARTDASAA